MTAENPAAVPPPAPALAPAPSGAPSGTRSGGSNPYLALGIVGFALSLLGPLSIAGLVVSIIALVASKRKGSGNGFALAGIIIACAALLTISIILALTLPALIDAAETCGRLGDGVHQVGSATYTCAPGSFSVHSGF